MKKIKEKHKLDYTIIRHRLEKDEQVNRMEFDIIVKREIPTLMPVQIRNGLRGNYLEFILKDSIDLPSHLRSGILFGDFLDIVRQIVETVRKCESYGIRTSNLELKTRYIYYHYPTKQVRLLYWPLISLEEYADQKVFFATLIDDYLWRREDLAFRNKYVKYFDNRRRFDIYHFSRALDDLRRDWNERAAQARQRPLPHSPDRPPSPPPVPPDLLRGVNCPVLARAPSNERIELKRFPFVIGRQEQKCDYALPDNHSVSRQHVVFTVRGNTVFLRDLKSLNGTAVDGRRIPPETDVALPPGSIIEFGGEQFIYYAPDGGRM